MSINGSAARRASAMHSHALGASPGLPGRDRRRIDHRRRASRLDPQNDRSFAAGQPEVMEMIDEAWDEIDPASLDGLDPAFDEIGELDQHVDGLSAWIRIGRAHPGSHGD